MQKNITQFKCTINDVESTFHFESNCSTAIAKEAILQCLKWIGQIEDMAKASESVSQTNESQEQLEENQEPQQEQPNE